MTSPAQASGRLHGKRVLITAAGQGIGRSSALACLREGAEVWASDIAADKLEELVQSVRAPDSTIDAARLHTVQLDVTKPEAIATVGRQLPDINVLFNCAGFVHHGTVLDASDDDWDFALTLNLKAMVRMIRCFLPGMLSAGSGSIINMSSVASSLKGVPVRCVYQTTKAAVIGLTKSVAADYVSQGIRCNAICPGTVATPSLDKRIEAQSQQAQADAQAVREAFVARQPIGRLGSASEIAELVVYLASDESSYTTGATHVIDGGWLT